MMFSLLSYQDDISTAGADILRKYQIWYLAMEVRVGKTFTFLAACTKYGARSVLCITKKKAIPSIVNDYTTMKAPFIFYCINFESLHKIDGFHFDVLVIDEADGLGQFPKPSERTKEIQKLAKHKPIIYVSGTPHPETPSQLYHQFWVSSFSPWRDHQSFYGWVKAGYVEVRKQFINNKEFNDYSRANAELISKETGHLFSTYSQIEAGFKQLVQEEVVYVKMKPYTYRLANTILKDRVYVGKNGNDVVADTAVKVQNKLHQIYSGTVKLEPKRVEQPDGSFKIEEADAIAFDDTKVQYILKHYSGLKLAIFYKFIAEGDMLKKAFSGRWTDSPEAFNADPYLIFICQISSGKQGVNLSTADLQVMLNIDFSANSYWQGRARQSKRDREREVRVVWIFAHGGIEDYVYKTVMDKKDYTLQFFKRDFMPWLEAETILLSKKQQAVELARAEAAAAEKEAARNPHPVTTRTTPNIWSNIFDDPFK